MQTLTTFDTWQQLQDHIRAGYPLWYHAPMDHRAVMITAFVQSDGEIRVRPPAYSDADPFTADQKHLPRFRRDYSRVKLAELQKAGHDVTNEGGA